jgi:serine/threonine-protein kinase
MGEVHRAYDTARGRTVALKRLPVALAGDPEYQARFRRESALAAQLSEPHIIPIHDFGEINGRLYIDMRLVEGTDLASVIKSEGPMAPRRAVGILAQVGAALDAAHSAGLVHRDVKPSNVLVSGHDEDEFAYLIDFGIARAAAGATSGPALTVTGATLGTLDYMAPERFENRPVDGRVDVYSLACMLFELLTGGAPFHGRTPAGMIHAHMSLDPPRPSAQRPGLPPELDAVVERGMAKRPEQRYPTAGTLVAAARAAVRGSATQAAAPHIPTPRVPGPRTATYTSAPHASASPFAGPHTPSPHTARPHTPGPHTPTPYTAGPHTPAPRTPAPHTPPPPSLQKSAPPSLQKTPSTPQPAPWRPTPTPPPNGRCPTPPAPGQWTPPTYPARPGSTVVAFVLQLVSGGLFLVGSLVSLIGGVVLGLLMALLSALYIACAIKAFGGRGWARITLAVVNAVFGVFCLIVIPFGLTDASSTAGERAGGIFVLLLLAAMAVACTLPMFTRPARNYAAAKRAT